MLEVPLHTFPNRGPETQRRDGIFRVWRNPRRGGNNTISEIRHWEKLDWTLETGRPGLDRYSSICLSLRRLLCRSPPWGVPYFA